MSDNILLLGMAVFGFLGFLSSKGIISILNIVDKAIIKRGPDRQAGNTMSVLACFLSALTYMSCANLVIGLTGCLFWGSLSAAAYSDGMTKEIFDWVYLPGIAASIIMLVICKPEMSIIIDLGIFLALQVLVFRLMYGGSDCIAFSMCAIFLSFFGCGLLECMLMMLLTLILFTVWQWLGNNIHTSKNSIEKRVFLKLKQPDAMIPYIFMSMFLFMIYLTIPFVYAALLIAMICITIYLLM